MDNVRYSFLLYAFRRILMQYYYHKVSRKFNNALY